MDEERATRLLAHPRMPKLGEAIAGRYEVHQCLGTGAFAAVYLASDRGAGGRLAIKVLQPEKSDQQSFADRFWQEVKVVRTLTHHNTIKVWDAGKTERGCLFMVMEYVDGESLQTIIEREGPLPPERVVRIARQILLSLSEAHQLGVIHRDLKPANVMVRQQTAEPDYVKVLDFGIAKALASELSVAQTRAGEFFGSAQYAAPELLKNQDVGPPADLYALGLIMLEMLTGHPAVQAGSMPEVIARQASAEPVAVPATLASTSLGRVISRAVQKDASARFQSAEAMLEALMETAQTAAWGGPPSQPQREIAARLPEIGEVMNGRYHLQKLIGSGGFGSVFLAEDRLAGGRLAIKVINPSALVQANAADRFRQEAAVVRHLHHHNTIKIWDIGTSETGCLFMAMEFVDGEPLDQVIKEAGRLSVPRTLRIGVQILRSLAEAHAQGIVHRDLKPGNILVAQLKGEADYVKVLDFGIAKALSAELSMVETQAGQVMCTPAYASPELLKGEKIAPSMDVYAAGLLMIEMLTGARPVPGSSPIEWMVNQIAPDPIEIPPEIEARPLGKVLRKAVEKDVTKRYKDADEMLEALYEAEQIESQPAFPVSGPFTSGPGAAAGVELATLATPKGLDAGAETMAAARRAPDGAATRRLAVVLIVVVLLLGGAAAAFLLTRSTEGPGTGTPETTANTAGGGEVDAGTPGGEQAAAEIDAGNAGGEQAAAEADAGTPGGEQAAAETDAGTPGGEQAVAETDAGTPGGEQAAAEADAGTPGGEQAAAEADAGAPGGEQAANEPNAGENAADQNAQSAADREAERQRQAERERRRQAEREAERQRQAEAEAEAERQRQAEAEAERQRQAEAEAEAEAERQRQAEQQQEADAGEQVAIAEPNPDLPRQLSAEDINSVMRASLDSAADCRPADAPAGTVEVPVQITVASDGSVRSANAGAHAAAACIEGVVGGLHFPPFSRSSQSFRYTYLLR